VFVGDAVVSDAQAISVLEVVTHPEFDADTRRNDVAVLWLAQPVAGVTPEILPEPRAAPPGLNDRVTLAGFGATRAGTAPDGLKRIGVGRVAELRAGVVTVSPDPSVSCVGDSGGPLFDEAGDLTGVASSGDAGCIETSVYALIAPTIEGFIEPVLDLGPAERPAMSESCGVTCSLDSDCPVGLVCVPGPEGPDLGCALPGQEAGVFTQACADDQSCPTGLCARTTTSEHSGDSNRGCSVRRENERGVSIWLVALLAWLGLRSRPQRAATLALLRRRDG
jgi:hypothetical protein